MKLGNCIAASLAPEAARAGFDFVEVNAQHTLQGTQPDDEKWDGERVLAASPLAVPAANAFVPATHLIVGPKTDEATLDAYAATTLRRAELVGIKTMVFGSAVARKVPDGFSRETAKQQVVRFLAVAAPVAQKHGVTIVVEALNRGECNFLNTLPEIVEIAQAVDHDHVKCLLDTYHFWVEDEPLKNLEAALPWIKHVHLADKEGRTLPGMSGKSDYKHLFRLLKQANYDGLFAIEGRPIEDFAPVAPAAITFTRRSWDAA